MNAKTAHNNNSTPRVIIVPSFINPDIRVQTKAIVSCMVPKREDAVPLLSVNEFNASSVVKGNKIPKTKI